MDFFRRPKLVTPFPHEHVHQRLGSLIRDGDSLRKLREMISHTEQVHIACLGLRHRSNNIHAESFIRLSSHVDSHRRFWRGVRSFPSLANLTRLDPPSDIVVHLVPIIVLHQCCIASSFSQVGHVRRIMIFTTQFSLKLERYNHL